MVSITDTIFDMPLPDGTRFLVHEEVDNDTMKHTICAFVDNGTDSKLYSLLDVVIDDNMYDEESILEQMNDLYKEHCKEMLLDAIVNENEI